MSVVAGEDIVNLRLEDQLERIDANIEEKKLALKALVSFEAVILVVTQRFSVCQT